MELNTTNAWNKIPLLFMYKKLGKSGRSQYLLVYTELTMMRMNYVAWYFDKFNWSLWDFPISRFIFFILKNVIALTINAWRSARKCLFKPYLDRYEYRISVLSTDPFICRQWRTRARGGRKKIFLEHFRLKRRSKLYDVTYVIHLCITGNTLQCINALRGAYELRKKDFPFHNYMIIV